MLFNPQELQEWRYCIGQCIFLINGEAIKLSELNVVAMEIFNDYANSIYSIFRMNFVLDDATYYKAIKNKTSLRMKLEIQKYYNTPKRGGSSLKKTYLKGTYATIEDSSDEYRLRSSDRAEKEDDAYIGAGTNNFRNTLELYFYKEEVATGFKKQINNILNNVTLSSAIAYSLTEAGLYNSVIMSPLENNKTYPVLLLPPITIDKLLLHLDACYGFYKRGSMIFFGVDRGYILNFKGECTAFENNELTETCVYIPNESTPSETQMGSLPSDGNKNYIVWNYGKVGFTNQSVISDVLHGSNTTVVSSKNANINSYTSRTITNGAQNTTMVENKGDNKWLGETITAQNNSKSIILAGSMSGVDLSSLTPNKKYTMVFEDNTITNKYRGNYMLTNLTVKFINDTARSDFNIAVAVEFRKMM